MIRNTRSRLGATLLAGLLVVSLLASAGAGVAAANHEDDSDDSDWFGDSIDDEPGVIEKAIEQVAKSISQARKGAARARSSSPLSDDPPTADESAQDAVEAFNADNDTARTWANTHLSGDEDHEVFRATFTDREDGTAQVYLVADYNTSTGEYSTAKAYNQSQFESLDRQVDANVEFGWYASENAADEFEAWVDRFGEPNEPMTSRYRADMLSKYAGDVEHDLS